MRYMQLMPLITVMPPLTKLPGGHLGHAVDATARRSPGPAPRRDPCTTLDTVAMSSRSAPVTLSVMGRLLRTRQVVWALLLALGGLVFAVVAVQRALQMRAA